GAHGASRVYVVEDDALAAPLPQPHVDALEAVVAESGAENILFAASVLAADVAAGLAARLEAGLNWDLTDLRVDGGELVGTRPALGDTVLVEGGWTSTPRIGLVPPGASAPGAAWHRPRPLGYGRSGRVRRHRGGARCVGDVPGLLDAGAARRPSAGGVE